ncbi:MAG: ExbD/TolR family protein [Verrucomicrobiota bacterium JB025]|nr:biopolymer transporter ExbD [Verrucomicrobiota bacterium JB025]
MIRLLIPSCCLLLVSSMRAGDLAEQDVAPPVAPDLSARPVMDIRITEGGEPRMDGVSFSDQQLAVVLRRIHSLEPTIVLRIRAARETGFGSVKEVIQLASEAGITDVIFSAGGESKHGEQGDGRPAIGSESDPAGGGRPQPGPEGCSR